MKTSHRKCNVMSPKEQIKETGDWDKVYTLQTMECQPWTETTQRRQQKVQQQAISIRRNLYFLTNRIELLRRERVAKPGRRMQIW